jgi:hypothetical protein
MQMNSKMQANPEILNLIRAKKTGAFHEILLRCGALSQMTQFADPKRLVHYLKSINLKVLFDVGSDLCCFFHDDENPSARLFQAASGDWLYYCHSSNCSYGGKTFNLIQIVALLQGVSTVEALRFLREACGAVIQFDKKANKNTSSIFDNAFNMLQNGNFDRICPTAAKIVKKPLLKALYLFGKDSLQKSGVDCSGDTAVFSVSNQQFRDAIGKRSFNRVSNFFALLAYLGLVRRIPLYELSDSRYRRMLQYLQTHRGYLPTNQIEIFRLTDKRLQQVEVSAKQWKKEGYAFSTFTYAAVYSKEGTFRAHQFFPSGGQLAGCKGGGSCDADHADFSHAVRDAIDEAIRISGAVSLDVLKATLLEKKFTRSHIHTSLKTEIDLLCRNGYQRVRENHRVLIVLEIDGMLKLADDRTACCQS